MVAPALHIKNTSPIPNRKLHVSQSSLARARKHSPADWKYYNTQYKHNHARVANYAHSAVFLFCVWPVIWRVDFHGGVIAVLTPCSSRQKMRGKRTTIKSEPRRLGGGVAVQPLLPLFSVNMRKKRKKKMKKGRAWGSNPQTWVVGRSDLAAIVGSMRPLSIFDGSRPSVLCRPMET